MTISCIYTCYHRGFWCIMIRDSTAVSLIGSINGKSQHWRNENVLTKIAVWRTHYQSCHFMTISCIYTCCHHLPFLYDDKDSIERESNSQR